MRIIISLILAAATCAPIFAQKPPDPEARNKRAVSAAPTRPGISAHKPARYEANRGPKSGTSSQELAKIEQNSVHQMKTARRTSAGTKPGTQAIPGTQAQPKSKPMKFSYQASKGAAQTGVKNPSPPVRSRPQTR